MKVFVYYNLHKHLWSVKALEGENKGRVIDHLSEVWLENATPKVSEAGRKRVLKEQRKNVHAGIVGNMVKFRYVKHGGRTKWRDVTYNPYKHTSFIYKVDEQPFTGNDLVLMKDKKVYSLEY
jgi:hypothetical protein